MTPDLSGIPTDALRAELDRRDTTERATWRANLMDSVTAIISSRPPDPPPPERPAGLTAGTGGTTSRPAGLTTTAPA